MPDLIGRDVQLSYEQQVAATIAITIQAFITEHRLSAVSLADLQVELLPTAQVADRDALDDNNGINDDETPRAASPASGPAREQLMGSPMLLSSLEQAAGPANPQGALPAGRSLPLRPSESLALRGVA